MRRVLFVPFACSLLLASVAAWSLFGHAQASSPAPGTIDTIAGGGTLTGDGILATSASLDAPTGVAVNAQGDVFFSDLSTCSIRKVSQGIISTAAGKGYCDTQHPFQGDGGPATQAMFSRPFGLAIDATGNLYIADSFNCVIRKVDATTSVITSITGSAATVGCGYSGDGGPALRARLFNPDAVAVDSGGNVYIADSQDCRVRKVTNGIITTIAGNGGASGPCTTSGDGGPAPDAGLSSPTLSVAVDSNGNVYITDGCHIREVSSGVIDTVAGNPSCSYTGDGAALAVGISPYLLATDSQGNLFIADTERCHVRRLAGGVVTTTAGSDAVFGDDTRLPNCGYSGDGGSATAAQAEVVIGVAVDGGGNLYFTELDETKAGKGHVRIVYHPLDAPATPTYTPTSTPTLTPTSTSTPTATATPAGCTVNSEADSDCDGCPDVNELQTAIGSEFHGGRRDPHNPWDYWDAIPDGQVGIEDIVAVVTQYYQDKYLPSPPNPPNTPNPNYTTATDRSGPMGPNAWDLGPPDGVERIDDVVDEVNQYFHDCS
jgi:hypothetical protein